MSSMPDLRLAPLRMVSPALVRGPLLDSMSRGGPAAGLRQMAALPAPGAQEPEPLGAQKPPLGIAGPGASAEAEAKDPPAPSLRRGAHPESLDPRDEPPAKELKFGDFLDIINPLQHIPIVSNIYRAITGDEISPSARIFGGFLFGGPLGFVTAIANAIFEEANGQDLGDTVIATLLGDGAAPDVQIAQTPGADSAIAWLDPATPTQNSQAPAAAAATAAQKAGDYLASPENLTGQFALGAFVRDLRESEQPASPAVAMQNPLGTATQASQRNIQLFSKPISDPQRDNPVMPVAFQAQAPDAGLFDPRFLGAASPDGAFAERMLNALDKYQDTARGGERNGNGRASVLDTQL